MGIWFALARVARVLTVLPKFAAVVRIVAVATFAARGFRAPTSDAERGTLIILRSRVLALGASVAVVVGGAGAYSELTARAFVVGAGLARRVTRSTTAATQVTAARAAGAALVALVAAQVVPAAAAVAVAVRVTRGAARG